MKSSFLDRPISPLAALVILSFGMPIVVGVLAMDAIVRHRQWRRDPEAKKRYEGEYPYHDGTFS